MNSLGVLFAIAAHKNMNMLTFDVKFTFLYGDLEEENYMEIPEGYENTSQQDMSSEEFIIWSETSAIMMD
jgi:hypothetical protein